MKTIQLQKALILVSIASGIFAAGCELIVDFDRTQIPVQVVAVADAGSIDAASLGDGATPVSDASDANAAEASTTDAAGDASDSGIADASDAG